MIPEPHFIAQASLNKIDARVSSRFEHIVDMHGSQRSSAQGRGSWRVTTSTAQEPCSQPEEDDRGYVKETHTGSKQLGVNLGDVAVFE